MSTWYRVGTYGSKIEPVEVERYTDSFVKVVDSPRRESRHTKWESIFPSEAEAAEHLCGLAEEKRAKALDQLNRANETLTELRAKYPHLGAR